MSEEKEKSQGDTLRLNQELSILYGLSQIVNQSIDLDEILQNSLEKMMEMTGVHSAGIYLFDERNHDLVQVAHRGFSRTFTKGMRRLKAGEGVTGKSALSGKSLFIEDYFDHPESRSVEVEEGLQSVAIIPLRSREKVYGTLNIAWRDVHRFTSSEKDLFNSIGEVISGALDRASLYAENVRRLEELRTLFSISQEIASKLELKVILQKIIESAVELLGVEAGWISLWEGRKQNYTVAVVQGLRESLIGREAGSLFSGIVGEICKKKAPVLYEDYDRHPNRWDELDSYRFKGVLGVPLIVREMIIGTMVVGSSGPDKRFQQNEVDLLFNFAHQAGIAIGNAQLYGESIEKIGQLTTLYEIGKVLSSTLDLDTLLKKATELLRDGFGYAVCCILLLDKETNELYVKQISGREFDTVKHLRFRVGLDGIVGWAAKSGEFLYVPDVTKEPRHFTLDKPPLSRSEAAFPLKARDRVIGVMNIESTELAPFSEEDLKVLSSFANQVSISIENAQLVSDLKQTLQNLKQAQDQIVQAEKLRALGEMASGVAHDFNNLLAVILGNIQLLSHQLNDLTLEEIRGRLQIVERASKDGAETVRRIQEFTGVRRDREFTSIGINEILKEVVVITQPRWKDQPQRKGLQIDLTTRLEEIPKISGNPSELREVLTNIIFNAVDAMSEGGRIILSSAVRGNWVEVRINDTGAGMSEEVKRKVFDPFFTTKGPTNSGLGMSVSYGIVKRHGGQIAFESEPGKGTTFILLFPAVRGQEKPSEKEIAPIKETRPARILVIDDEDAVRDILFRMLSAKGHEVALACNGEEGVDRVKSEPFDLVFTDLGMPKMSGWEVGKLVKGLDPKMPVVMITGWGMELNKEKMGENGIDLVVTKPFNFDQLISLISEVMEKKA